MSSTEIIVLGALVAYILASRTSGTTAGGSAASGAVGPLYVTPFDNDFRYWERFYNIPPWLLKAVAMVESSFRTDLDAPNFKGARGMMQLTPDAITDTNLTYPAGQPGRQIQIAGAYLGILKAHHGFAFTMASIGKSPHRGWGPILSLYNTGKELESEGIAYANKVLAWMDKFQKANPQ